jgi:hypothetical protein
LLIAGLCALIPLVGNVVASFVTVWTGGRSWLIVPTVGVVVAMLTALIQAYAAAPEPSPQPRPPGQQGWPSDASAPRGYGQTRGRGTPLPIALVTLIVVLGVGGWALTQGVRYGIGYITGNEPGTERLVGTASGSADGLRLKVESVEHTAHFTRVELLARNGSDQYSMTLPLFMNCTFTGSDGTNLKADPSRSDWSEQLSPGSLQRGTVIFGGHIPDPVHKAELRFARVFSFPVGQPTFETGPSFITVENIRLRAP